MAPDAVLTEAWGVFYQTYTGMLRRMAREFHLDAQQSEDLVQEAWARVIVNLSSFHWREYGAGLRGWLYTLIRNQALNFVRQRVRHPLKFADNIEISDIADQVQEKQLEACWDREFLQHIVDDVGKRVSPLNHRLMVLRWLEERSQAETAALLNLSEKQVTYRLHRLFCKLRAALAVYRGEYFGVKSTDFFTLS
jgi:RNA polymerase sigma-70 factor (ECF subfamily)